MTAIQLWWDSNKKGSLRLKGILLERRTEKDMRRTAWQEKKIGVGHSLYRDTGPKFNLCIYNGLKATTKHLQVATLKKG